MGERVGVGVVTGGLRRAGGWVLACPPPLSIN